MRVPASLKGKSAPHCSLAARFQQQQHQHAVLISAPAVGAVPCLGCYSKPAGGAWAELAGRSSVRSRLGWKGGGGGGGKGVGSDLLVCLCKAGAPGNQVSKIYQKGGEGWLVRPPRALKLRHTTTFGDMGRFLICVLIRDQDANQNVPDRDARCSEKMRRTSRIIAHRHADFASHPR